MDLYCSTLHRGETMIPSQSLSRHCAVSIFFSDTVRLVDEHVVVTGEGVRGHKAGGRRADQSRSALQIVSESDTRARICVRADEHWDAFICTRRQSTRERTCLYATSVAWWLCTTKDRLARASLLIYSWEQPLEILM